MKNIVLVSFFLIVFQTTYSQDYMVGADLSFVKEAEDSGFIFKENSQPKSCIQIFKDHGYNWVRLRLFHTPTELPNNLEYTIALAKDAKKQGFKFFTRLSLFRYLGRPCETIHTQSLGREISSRIGRDSLSIHALYYVGVSEGWCFSRYGASRK